jgi:hypothetical protein
VYLWGGGAGLDSSPFVPLGKAPGAWAAAGLEGAGEEVNSRSMSIGCGVGWSLIADMADDERRLSSSGGRLSGCELRSSYLEERLELERPLSRSRSFAR